VNLPPTWDINCPNFYSKRSQQWSKKKGENRSDKEKDKIFKHFFGFSGLLGPSEIGFAFHRINFFGLIEKFSHKG
jgi:hypothetical protein